MPNPKPVPRAPSLDPLVYVAHAVVNEKTDRLIRQLADVFGSSRSAVVRRALRIGLRQLKQDVAEGRDWLAVTERT